jgi:hypothetical protein
MTRSLSEQFVTLYQNANLLFIHFLPSLFARSQFTKPQPLVVSFFFLSMKLIYPLLLFTTMFDHGGGMMWGRGDECASGGGGGMRHDGQPRANGSDS